MTIRQSAVPVIISALLLIAFSIALAERKGHETPYGDFCNRCTQYGTCKSPMSHDESKEAITDYYHKKGFVVEIENKRGRFIKARIMDKGNIVDVIIFDRRTGRVRSIY